MATFNILETPLSEKELVFTGSNLVGIQITLTLPRVQITPSKAIEFISDKLGDINFSAEVLVADPLTGSFGTVTMDDSISSPAVEACYIGAGVVVFDGVDMGNILMLNFTPEVKRIDRWNHRVGTKRKDASFVNEVSAKVEFTADEYTYHNLFVAMFGG